MRKLLAIPLLPILLLGMASTASAQPIFAELSNHEVQITTGFTGADVLFFGAIEGPGDVVVTVRGPGREVVVRRKGRVSGIWVNQDAMTFIRVPAFYAVASTRPLKQIVSPFYARQEEISAENLRLRPSDDSREATKAEIQTFREALIRLRRRQGLFPTQVFEVRLIGEKLFRANIHFPANLPTGTYTVKFYLFRKGKQTTVVTTPLTVNKSGLSAEVAAFATEQSILYGLLAVLVAGLLGWLASVVFRKD